MNILTIARHDFRSYWVLGLHHRSVHSVSQGLFFNAWVLGSASARYSHGTRGLFYLSGGFAIAASILLTMRTIAEERASERMCF